MYIYIYIPWPACPSSAGSRLGGRKKGGMKYIELLCISSSIILLSSLYCYYYYYYYITITITITGSIYHYYYYY